MQSTVKSTGYPSQLQRCFSKYQPYGCRTKRFDYREERWRIIGRIDAEIFTACYTIRGPIYRIISLRRASRKERKAYEQA